jgi:hypothetical protein
MTQVVKARFLLEAVEDLQKVPWWSFIERTRGLKRVFDFAAKLRKSMPKTIR